LLSKTGNDDGQPGVFEMTVKASARVLGKRRIAGRIEIEAGICRGKLPGGKRSEKKKPREKRKKYRDARLVNDQDLPYFIIKAESLGGG